MKSLERRMFEAFKAGRGVRLSADDLYDLVVDDAIGTRITNEACDQASVKPAGVDCVGNCLSAESWGAFIKRMKSEGM